MNYNQIKEIIENHADPAAELDKCFKLDVAEILESITGEKPEPESTTESIQVGPITQEHMDHAMEMLSASMGLRPPSPRLLPPPTPASGRPVSQQGLEHIIYYLMNRYVQRQEISITHEDLLTVPKENYVIIAESSTLSYRIKSIR